MYSDQVILFSLLGIVFGLLIWGKIRYDLVAFGALIFCVVIGVIPEEKAFEGFSHHATVIIALVLIVSRGLSNSGAIELIAKYVIDAGRSLFMHISVMSAVAAGLSALMNNVAALALLMPMDIQAAEKAKRSPSLTLMPLSFASILGGMITMIGTPPNIIIASFREQALGESFGMFAFTPVGLVAAVVGVAFVALIGWRLIPNVNSGRRVGQEIAQIKDYIAELKVGDESPFAGQKVNQLDSIAESADIAIIGLSRRGKRLPGHARREVIQSGDMLIIEASAKNIDSFVGENGLEYIGADKHDSIVGEDLSLLEIVIPEGARMLSILA